MQKDIKILILSQDTTIRVNLKEAITRVLGKCAVLSAINWKRALSTCLEEGDITAIFIRSTIPTEDIESLQNELEKSELRYSPLFFITLHSDHHASDIVSGHYVSGIEGFLKEPFATDDVDQAIRLAVTNRDRGIDDRQRELEAIQFMFREGFKLLDQAAIERNANNGAGGGFALRRMKRLRLRTRSMMHVPTDDELTQIIELEGKEAEKNLDLSKFVKKTVVIEFAEHPGKILSDILDERSLSSERLCELINIEDELLLGVLEQRENITAELSKELARVIGNTEDYWVSLQSKYDLYERSTKN